MTLAFSTGYTSATVAGDLAAVPFNFPVYAASDLTVEIRDATTNELIKVAVQPTDYVVTGIGAAAGGTVQPVNGSVFAAGRKAHVYRNTEIKQVDRLRELAKFPGLSVEQGQDRQTAMVQDLQRRAADLELRALRSPFGEQAPVMPAAPDELSLVTRKAAADGGGFGYSSGVLQGVVPDSAWNAILTDAIGSRWRKLLAKQPEFISPMMLDAEGDGVADDYDSFVAAELLARASNLPLDGERRDYRFGSLLDLSGAGNYNWRNMRIYKSAQTATDYERTVQITGAGFSTPVALTANVAPGATTITVADASGLARGDVAYLVSDTLYSPSYTIASIVKGEWIRIWDVNVGTGVITTSAPIRSSHTTGNTARIYKFNQTCNVSFDNVEFLGGGHGLKQLGVRLNYANLRRFSHVRVHANEYTGAELQNCVGNCAATIEGSDASLDGYGYIAAIVGCFSTYFESAVGHNARHTLAYGAAGGLLLPGGATVRVMGQGGGFGHIHCEGAKGAPFDVHIGHVGGGGGNVTGTMTPGTGEEAMTVQSPDWKFGNVQVLGGDQGLLIQSWGKPTDEKAFECTVGDLDFGRGGTGTNRGLAIGNYDANARTAVHVTVNSLSCDYPGLVTLNCEEADIFCDIPGGVRGKSRTVHSLHINSSANGRGELRIGGQRIRENSGNAAVYAAYAEGAAYEGAHPGQKGALIQLGPGLVHADNTAFRGNDGLVEYDPELIVNATTLALQGGVGGARPIRRRRLSADLYLYVRAGGNDANTGMADVDAAAFQTLTRARAEAMSYDHNGYRILIHVRGAFTHGVALWSVVGDGSVEFIGDVANPATNTITVTGGSCFAGADVRGKFAIRGIKMGTVSSGNTLSLQGAGLMVDIDKVDFGACAGHQMNLFDHARVAAVADYAISGGGATHINALREAVATLTGRTVTITNTPAFNPFVAFARLAHLDANGVTWTGAATGSRYSADRGAQINVNGAGATALPGNAAGSTSNGGTYA